MMRPRIDRCLLAAACVLCVATSEAAPAVAPGAPVPCPKVDDAARRMHRDCAIHDEQDKPPALRAGHQRKDANRSESDTPPEPSPRSGHFDAHGGTGLIPAGRLGWREIGNWREMRRVRIDREVQQ